MGADPRDLPSAGTAALLGAALDALPGCLALLDQQGRIAWASEAWRRGARFCLGNGAGPGANYLAVLDELGESGEREAVALARGLRGLLEQRSDVYAMEYPAEPDRGELVWLAVEARLFRHDGGAWLVVQHREVTERRASEERQRHQEKMHAVGQLAEGLAHDFNNLITAIAGHAELVLDELGERDPHRSSLRAIHQAADRGSALTRQLLTFSRRQVLSPEIVDLAAAVGELEPVLRRRLPAGVRLELEIDGHAQVRIDRSQLRQVLVQLVDNAHESMDGAGRIVLRLRDTEVDDALSQRHPQLAPGAHAVLEVEDDGCGMDEDTIARSFEPFFTTKGRTHSGLGLSTVYGIVQQSGGSILVTSRVRSGSLFRVFLPVVEVPEERQPATTAAGEVPDSPRTILLVEDEQVVRVLVRQLLERAGYVVLEARDGQEALRLASNEPERPIELVLTDVVMPGLSGRDLVARLMPMLPDLKVIYMSGYTQGGRLGGGDELRPFLAKPFTPDSLLRKVREALG
jgi:signal transduction histidine kinase/CheY-like chemotaxis protein